MGRLAQVLGGQSQSTNPTARCCMAKGGVVKHDDAAQDKKMIAAELKKRGLKCGGKVKK